MIYMVDDESQDTRVFIGCFFFVYVKGIVPMIIMNETGLHSFESSHVDALTCCVTAW